MGKNMKAWMALALAATVSGCGGASSVHAAAPVTPTTFAVTGSMLISPDYTQLWSDTGGQKDSASIAGKQCRGGAGYDDIAAGSQVTIRNGDGKVVAVGSLDSGITQVIGDSGEVGLANCSFALTVDRVPQGSKFYSVEVAHRGQVQFTATAIRQPLSLNLK
jgi:hypothetical protein